MFQELLAGAQYVTKGCASFYHDRKAWRFVLAPVGTMLLVYVLALWGIYFAWQRLIAWIDGTLEELPHWLGWLGACGSWLAGIVGVLVAFLLICITICTFYEMFGGLFFDSLVEYFEQKKYGQAPAENTLGETLLFCWDSIRFGIKNLLAFVLLLVFSFFFPVVGHLLLLAVMSYFLGASYLMTPANNARMRLRELKKLLRGKTCRVLGFGLLAYFLLLIPFVIIFLLPGLVLGGAELFHDIRQERG